MISELKTFYRIYADTRNENTGKIVTKQNDTKTRYLDITVTDNGVPVDLTGCEVRIYGRKKDGTEFYNDGTLQDAENGRCLFEATTQMLAYAGQNVNCEIVVFKDNEQILSTMPFDIFVVESLMGESAIESSNEYGALVVLYQNLYEAIDLMTTMVQNIGSPSTVAEQYNLETMWQAWEFLTDYMKTDLTQMIENALANSSVQGVLDVLNTTTAKQSTSEEILEKVANIWGLTKSVTGNLTTSAKAVVSVSGKGVLYGFAQLHCGGTSTVLIVVDGVTIVNAKLTGTNTSYPVMINVGKPSDVYYIADGSTTRSEMAHYLLYDTYGSYSMKPLGVHTLSATQWSSSQTGGVFYVPMVQPITFNESLVITCKGSTTDDMYGCLYEMRD